MSVLLQGRVCRTIHNIQQVVFMQEYHRYVRIPLEPIQGENPDALISIVLITASETFSKSCSRSLDVAISSLPVRPKGSSAKAILKNKKSRLGLRTWVVWDSCLEIGRSAKSALLERAKLPEEPLSASEAPLARKVPTYNCDKWGLSSHGRLASRTGKIWGRTCWSYRSGKSRILPKCF